MNISSASHPMSAPLFGAKKPGNNSQKPVKLTKKEQDLMDDREAFVRQLDEDGRIIKSIANALLLRNVKKHPIGNKMLKDGLADLIPIAGDLYTSASHATTIKKAHKLGLGWKVVMAMMLPFAVDAGLDVGELATGEVSPPAIVLDVVDTVPLAAFNRALLEETARLKVKKDMALKAQLNQKNGWQA